MCWLSSYSTAFSQISTPKKMAEFKGALQQSGKWNVLKNPSDDKYNPDGYKLQLKIPVESVVDYCNYLMALVDNPEAKYHTDIKMWDHDAKQEKMVKCIKVTHNAKPSKFDDDGWYGFIAPMALDKPQAAATTEACSMPAPSTEACSMPAPQTEACSMPVTVDSSEVPF